MNDLFCPYYFRVRPERISLFRFLLEGYDGLAILSTLEADRGLVQLLVPRSRLVEAWGFFDAICDEIS